LFDYVCGDIGAPTLGGGQSLGDGDVLTVSGGGVGIGATTDAFHYVWTPSSGSTVSALVSLAPNSPGGTKAGVMVRRDSAPSSPYYLAALVPGSVVGTVQIVVDVRATAGATTQRLTTTVAVPLAAIGLRIVQTGDTFSASYEPLGGTVWLPLPGSTIVEPLAASSTRGLVISGGDDATRGQAQFTILK